MKLLTCRLRNGPPNDFPIEYLADSSDRPNSMELSASQWVDIPTISLAQTRFNNLYDLQRLVDDVCAASASYGMFQVVDHGVPESVLTNAMTEGVGFFQMPSQELEAFSEASEGRLYSSSKMHACGENTINFNWRDVLVLGLNSPRQIQDWPVHPPLLKSRILEFALGVNAVENKILTLINQGLGLRPNYFNDNGLNKASAIVIDHNPICPQPTWACGLPKIGDMNLLTISIQGGANGLQIWKDEEWKFVVPSRNAVLVKLGRQMEIVTNGILKTPEYRVIVNSQAPQTSISYFSGPCNECVVGPAEELTRTVLPRYRKFPYAYYSWLHFKDYRTALQHVMY